MKQIRRWMRFFANTPIHPQWLAFKDKGLTLDFIRAHANGLVLDVGCADKSAGRVVSEDCRYIGLDYYKTAQEWYRTRPDLFGDAHRLPVRGMSADTVLLLDVMEHLRSPDDALAEIMRVLKPVGKLILQVPFLYPIHDAPLDFQRWTRHGLEALLQRHGFIIIEYKRLGRSLESAALLLNLALSKAILNWIGRRHPAALAVVLLPLFVTLSNLLAWLFSRLMPDDDMMPLSYLLLAVKA
jgi:SAM-dependent methyltransferase